MSKRTKIVIGICALLYVFALVVFHVTYRYPMYWMEESTVIVIGSLIYVSIGLILYWALKRQVSIPQLSGISVKSLTKIVACTSALKALLYICIYSSNDFMFMINYQDGLLIINTMCWTIISVFFFTLYKKMR